jgi:hypothetical protein
MPHAPGEIPVTARGPNMMPPLFFCVLYDDSLVTDLNVSTGRLLQNRQTGHVFSDEVMAIVRVHVSATTITFGNTGYTAWPTAGVAGEFFHCEAG